MRRSEAARYARWAAAAAVALTLVVAVVYSFRAWKAAESRRAAPPVVPAPVQKLSQEISFSKEEQGRTLFTVRASRTTEYREGGKNLLEDVWITIYGRTGKRYDNIHTRECDYVPSTGRVSCAGEVQIDLESAVEAREHPGERVIHVGTRDVSFDRESGEAWTAQPVIFRFPYGQGGGVGLTYSTRQGVVRLRTDVMLTLTHSGSGAPLAAPVKLTGSAMEYRREERRLRLLGPVRAQQGSRELLAGSVDLLLSAQMRPELLVASEQPRLRDASPEAGGALTADEFRIAFHPGGAVARVEAVGRVNGNRRTKGQQDQIAANRIEVEMHTEGNQPRALLASGNVRAESRTAGSSSEARRLETQLLRLWFAEQSGGLGTVSLTEIETLAPALVELSLGSASPPLEFTRLRGERLRASFGAANRIRELRGDSGIEIERRYANAPNQWTGAEQLAMVFDTRGEWSEASLEGAVRYRESERAAEAQRARMVRATDLLTLTGSVRYSEPGMRTAAATLSVNQRTGDIRGDGGVRTTSLPSSAPAAQPGLRFAPVAAHIAARQLVASREQGRAVYSGDARLWQGDTVVEAETISLVRETRQLSAQGRVLVVFPAAASGREREKAGLWRIRAGRFDYHDESSRAEFRNDVTASSPQGQMDAARMDVFLSAAGEGGQQVSRIVGAGGVTLRQGQRRGVAEQAEYSAAEEKFVLSGGNPTLFDPARGTTSGRQLTFFLADDKILVESDSGSRTLTRHRVP